MSVPNGPHEGNWSVFAEQVVRERDEARTEIERLKQRIQDLEDALICESSALGYHQCINCDSTIG